MEVISLNCPRCNSQYNETAHKCSNVECRFVFMGGILEGVGYSFPCGEDYYVEVYKRYRYTLIWRGKKFFGNIVIDQVLPETFDDKTIIEKWLLLI